MTIALYPGSFDPFTLGHLSVLEAASALFSKVVVGVGSHPTKRGLLDPQERLALVHDCVSAAGLSERVEAQHFDGLVVDAARRFGAAALVRGVRDGTDLDYELQMVGMNGTMAPSVHTVILPPSPETRHISGTLVRQIHAMGGDVSPFVPAATLALLRARAS